EGVDTATPRGDDTQAAGQPVDLVDASWGDAFDPFGEPVPSPEEPENELPERPSDASEVVSAAAPGPLRAAGAPAPEPFPRGAHEPVRRSGTPDAPRPVRRPPPPARSEERGRRWVLIAIAIVVAIIAAAVLGLIDIPGFGSGEAEDAGDSTALQAAPVDATVASATPPVEDAPPLGFSVALGSYQDGVVAARRARALADRVPDVLVLSVPVRLDGTLYHRVLAGPASDSADASRLAGVIARALGADPSRWVLRPTPWAFRLGELPDLETARRRVEVLTDLGIPAYVVAVDYSDGSSRYRVYAGAYADELEAAHLEALLTERGLSTATLSERIGRLPE
ncbi:MAG TPA: SPOR domain-containing protein, partial [Longimicrobiales bacterium]|nr:SPOR domain-containing protein [Longimicrobiales bacterium]